MKKITDEAQKTCVRNNCYYLPVSAAGLHGNG